MEPNNTDKLMLLEYIKREVAGLYDEVRADAKSDLETLNESQGVTELISPFFGASAGKFKMKYGKAKTVVDYELADEEAFAAWMVDNQSLLFAYMKQHVAEFAKSMLEEYGELVGGIKRTERVEPERVIGSQIYSFKPEAIEAKLGENLLADFSQRLLGDSHE